MWKMFTAAFISIFLAELGDKTQIALFTMSAKERSFLPVFLGASLSMVLSNLIATLIGKFAGVAIPGRIMNYIAGSVFVIFGVLMFFGKV